MRREKNSLAAYTQRSLWRGVSANLHQKKSKKNPRDYGAVRSLESGGGILRLAYLDDCEKTLAQLDCVHIMCVYQLDLGRLLETVNVAIGLHRTCTCHLHAASFTYGYAALT